MPEGFCETRVTQRRGARWSTADAYLRPALKRPNLTLLTEAAATKVLFEGRRAVGVEFEKGGSRQVVRARREVVLCGGAINSPQLLMLSGIGDRDQLGEHGIDVVAQSAGRRRQSARPPGGAAGIRRARTTRCSRRRNPWNW